MTDQCILMVKTKTKHHNVTQGYKIQGIIKFIYGLTKTWWWSMNSKVSCGYPKKRYNIWNWHTVYVENIEMVFILGPRSAAEGGLAPLPYVCRQIMKINSGILLISGSLDR